MIVHMVLMRFDDAADAEETARRLRELPSKIDVIRRFVVGTPVLTTPNSYDLGLLVEFDSADDLKTYVGHPAHEEASEFSRARRSAVASCDIAG